MPPFAWDAGAPGGFVLFGGGEAGMSKYKIGDRVIYHPIRNGNEDLEGWTGTVVYVDNTKVPYTIRLDHPYIDGLTDARFSTKKKRSRSVLVLSGRKP